MNGPCFTTHDTPLISLRLDRAVSKAAASGGQRSRPSSNVRKGASMLELLA